MRNERPGTRLPLTRERILEVALAQADADGVESITMRGLGEALGYEAMSLYNHVASKHDLLEGMLDRVLAETEPPSAEGPWRPAVRRSALSVHEALIRHRWACTLLMSSAGIRPARLRYMDALLGRLRDAGFTADETYVGYHVLDAHIFGFSLWESSHRYTPEQFAAMSARLEGTVTPETHPHLLEHARQHGEEGPHRELSAFTLGLDLILDGLEKQRRARRSARRSSDSGASPRSQSPGTKAP